MKCIIDWEKFREYCFRRFSPYNAGQLYNTALNSFETFLRMYNCSHDALKWVLEVKEKLLYYHYFPICFQALTGLRPTEAISSLNLIAVKGLDEYYNREYEVLEHFRYPNVFLRGTKNAFISIVSENLLERLKEWRYKTSYNMIKLALKRRGFKLQLQELRVYYATFLRQKNIPKESIDLIQGRIPRDVFVRFYYKPNILQLKNQVLEAIKTLENQLF